MSSETLLLLIAVAVVGAVGFAAVGRGERDAIAGTSRGEGAPAGELAVAAPSGILAAQAGVAEAAAKVARAADDGAALAEHIPARGALLGEESTYWKLFKQGTLLFGGQRALLLQVADPAVAAGVSKFSSFRENPVGRLARTMDAMIAVTFGSPEQRAAMLKQLKRVHAKVRGTTADGAAYSAHDPALKFWIHATLVDTAIEVERRFSGKFTDADRARYYEESKALARAFEVPEEFIPADYRAFQKYMADRIASLRPSAESIELSKFLMRPEVRGVPKPALAPLAWVTRSLLPASLREAYGMKRLNFAERAAVRSIEVTARTAIPPLMDATLRIEPARNALNSLLERFSTRQ